MPWLKLSLGLEAQEVNNAVCSEEWETALETFLFNKGFKSFHRQVSFPGYSVVKLDESETSGEIVLSEAEQAIVLKNLQLAELEEDFAAFVCQFAQLAGIRNLFIVTDKEHKIWYNYGATALPERQPLKEEIVPHKLGVKPLKGYALYITFKDDPVLCLEPILCTARSQKVISLSQRKLESTLGIGPIGFASRTAVQCPWIISQEQWHDLLQFSRLQCFDTLYQIVISQP